MKTMLQIPNAPLRPMVSLLAGLCLLAACDKAPVDPNQADASARGGATATRYPLYIPPATTPAGLSLSASPGTADLGGGKFSTVWAYNGTFPGPTIVANRGDNASIVFRNNLPEQSITHWHGMIVSPENDGQPHQTVPSGGSYSYNFPINQRAALNWYHPHPHMLTGKQVYNGLAGAFILRDQEEAALGLPSGAYEVPLIIRDAQLDKSGNLQYKPTSGGFLGNTRPTAP